MRSRARVVAVLPLVLLLACISTPPNTTPTSPTETALKVADFARRLGLAAEGLQKVEIAMYRLGRVTPETHKSIQTAFLRFSETALPLLDSLKTLGAPAVTKRQAASAILDLVDQLAAEVLAVVQDVGARAELTAAIQSVQTLALLLKLAV